MLRLQLLETSRRAAGIFEEGNTRYSGTEKLGTRVTEFHGAKPLTPLSQDMARKHWCPFTDTKCKKKNGACSLQATKGDPVIICPNRLYFDSFKILTEVAVECFGNPVELLSSEAAEDRRRRNKLTGNEILVLGQGFSSELGIKAPVDDEGAGGSFSIDFMLIKVDPNFEPAEFVAVEVQTIDTTNSYADAAKAFYSGKPYLNKRGTDETGAGFNWENVAKRILPQIIYKGHALRREDKAANGLYFVLPQPVYEKIKTRVGGDLLDYPRGPGTVTFHSYSVAADDGNPTRPVELSETFTTTVEQIAFAFVSPQNLPPRGEYEKAISERIENLSRKRKLDL